ncbi:MAG: hypothetical protein GX444_20095 [Myxococcales bacterium]|nr:hypothetical protein [Myxococcales bacterium]
MKTDLSFLAFFLLAFVFCLTACGGDDSSAEPDSGAGPGPGQVADDDQADDDDHSGVDFPGRPLDQAPDGGIVRLSPFRPMDTEAPVIGEVDEDDDDPPDQEYAPVLCRLPDPEGLGEGTLIGGGVSVVTQRIVYIYDDETCAPLANSFVYLDNNHDGYQTDGEGRVVFAAESGEHLLTAWHEHYWPWTYRTDQPVAYFRLHSAYKSDYYYADSVPGRFLSDGEDLPLVNPQTVDEAFTQPLFGGVLLPGLPRQAWLNSTSLNLFTEDYFRFYYEAAGYTGDVDLPTNLYLPSISILFEVPGMQIFGFYGANTALQVPLLSSLPDKSLQGFVFQLDAASVVNLDTIIAMIQAGWHNDDYLAYILPLVKPLFERGLKFPYIGARPSWDGSGAPDLELAAVPADCERIDFSVVNPEDGADYFFVLGAEIPNRALLPLAVGAYGSETSLLPFTRVPDADYLALGIKTDVFATAGESCRAATATRYAESPNHWNHYGVIFDNADFLPYFSPETTYYDAATGTLHWGFEGKFRPRVDAYLVFYVPDDFNPVYAWMMTLPGDLNELQLPLAPFGIAPSEDDIILLVAFDMPADFDPNHWDPSALFGYDIESMSLWVHPDLITLFGG